jgi:hypothetical protein
MPSSGMLRCAAAVKSDGRPVGIVHLGTKIHGVFLYNTGLESLKRILSRENLTGLNS